MTFTSATAKQNAILEAKARFSDIEMNVQLGLQQTQTDLQGIQQYFGAHPARNDWMEAQPFDMNGNGEVDIFDVTEVNNEVSVLNKRLSNARAALRDELEAINAAPIVEPAPVFVSPKPVVYVDAGIDTGEIFVTPAGDLVSYAPQPIAQTTVVPEEFQNTGPVPEKDGSILQQLAYWKSFLFDQGAPQTSKTFDVAPSISVNLAGSGPALADVASTIPPDLKKLLFLAAGATGLALLYKWAVH